ncbi:hypothetical protein ABPG72_019793 [Tetrahymena utriculariae]
MTNMQMSQFDSQEDQQNGQFNVEPSSEVHSIIIAQGNNGDQSSQSQNTSYGITAAVENLLLKQQQGYEVAIKPFDEQSASSESQISIQDKIKNSFNKDPALMNETFKLILKK